MEIKQVPIVEQVTPETMAGDSVLEKCINVLITRHFISSSNIPADECLDEARELIRAKFNKEETISYLRHQFGISIKNAMVETVADTIIYLINNLKDS